MAYSGTAAQAYEARRVSKKSSMRLSLLWQLAHRPLWVLGTALNIAAFGVQLVALSLVSLAIVQPTFATGLIVLAVIAVWKLDEHVGRRETLGIALILSGLVGIAFVAPRHTRLPLDVSTAVVLFAALLGIVAVLAAIRVTGRTSGLVTSLAAGLAYAWLSFSAALVGEAFTRHSWTWVVVWAAATVACAVLAVVTEMTALQHWPVTRSKPVVFVLQTMVPAAAAPFFVSEFSAERAGVFVVALLVVASGSVAIASSGAMSKAMAA